MSSSVKQKSNACIDEVRSLRRCLKTYSECVKSGGKVSECLRSEGSPQECAVREISLYFLNNKLLSSYVIPTTEICQCAFDLSSVTTEHAK